MLAKRRDRIGVLDVGIGVAGPDDDAAAARAFRFGGSIAVTSALPSSSRSVRNSGIARRDVRPPC